MSARQSQINTRSHWNLLSDNELRESLSKARAAIRKREHLLQISEDNIRQRLSSYKSESSSLIQQNSYEQLASENDILRLQLEHQQKTITHLEEELRQAETERNIAISRSHHREPVLFDKRQSLISQLDELYEKDFDLLLAGTSAQKRWELLARRGPTKNDVITHDDSFDVVEIHKTIVELQEATFGAAIDARKGQLGKLGPARHIFEDNRGNKESFYDNEATMSSIATFSHDCAQEMYDLHSKRGASIINLGESASISWYVKSARNPTNTGTIVTAYYGDESNSTYVGETTIEDPPILDHKMLKVLKANGLDEKAHPQAPSFCSWM